MKKQDIFLGKKIFLIGFSLLLLVPAGVSSQEPTKGLKLIEAVKKTLIQQPFIHIQEGEVEVSKGILQEATGQFDPTIGTDISRAHESTPLTQANEIIAGHSKNELSFTTYKMSLNKQFRSGISVSPNVQMTRTDDRISGVDTTNEASVNFTVILPILKGRGRKATGAEEMAAQRGLEASEMDLRHTISSSILETGVSYWNVLAAVENLEILQETESRARKLVKSMEELVKADEHPRSDLAQLRANQAAKTRAKIQGEQFLYEARQNLGIAMGLLFNEIDTLPHPVNSFPRALSIEDLSIVYDKRRFIQLCKQHRTDYIASQKREEAAKILLTAATINQMPKLDLNLNVGYKGLDETDSESGYYNALHENTRGLNASAIITFQYPFGNNAARGLVHRRKFRYQQALIRTADLERNIHSDIAVALNALIQSTKELQEARESVAYYQKAVENEKLKFGLGMSTVIDVVTFEDDLRNALLSEVSAQQKYVIALLQLRFTTGTMLSIKNEQYSITMEQLVHIPTLEPNE